ncbi:FMN-binding glutamate synthase family protein [Saccharospirillum sp. HFRX-1]|uniref:FMN-binding glutamate synthase family protein n=1 Tax=unclassified Saccharospirillum TaxID=2633430 RepID=UPI0037120AB4
MSSSYTQLGLTILAVAGLLIVAAVIILCLVLIYLYISDRRQRIHTIRRNYPILGRFRYLFEHLGEFFRQYFFAMDREELPFNRAERSWVYRAAKNLDNTIAFGSTRSLEPIGSVFFMNDAFPTLEDTADHPLPITIGPDAKQPYQPKSFFNISGMSYGALSAPAVRALSFGAAKAGCWMNTGEGALSRFHLEGGCDLVFQIGTAKYGVRDKNGNLSDEKLREIAAHEQVRMFEIKLSQGAKPGKGGILPGEKVTEEIARARGIPEGEDSISPNRHLDIEDGDDLLDMIQRVRNVTGKPVGFKCVLGETGWLVALLRRIKQRGLEYAPDFITLDSADGGTGAAPQPLMDYVGLPIKESLPWLIDTLKAEGLRERIKVVASGKLMVPSKVGWALATGADFIVSARGFMFALGCVQSLQCNRNTCPTGVTTHNPRLQRGLVPADKAERVAHYHAQMVHFLGILAHSCGVAGPRELARKHVRIVTQSGISMPLDTFYQRHIPLTMIEPSQSPEQTQVPSQR